MKSPKAFVMFFLGTLYSSMVWLALTTSDKMVREAASLLGGIATVFVILFIVYAAIEVFED